MTDKTLKKPTLTTIGIDRQTNRLVDKLCKRYSLKKGEIVKLAFLYMDKACINPAEAPESTKAELSKINKRQDDIIRFIRNYEEKELNPIIRVVNSIAVRFKDIADNVTSSVNRHIEDTEIKSKSYTETIDSNFYKLKATIEQHASIINNLVGRQTKFENKQIKLLSLYEELSHCGIGDGKKKEHIKRQIKMLVENNNQTEL